MKLTKRQNKLIKNESEVNRIFEKGGGKMNRLILLFFLTPILFRVA